MLSLGIATFSAGICIGWVTSALFTMPAQQDKPDGTEFNEHEII